MLEIKQIGSQFYCCIVEENGDFMIISSAYPTYEMALSFSGADDL